MEVFESTPEASSNRLLDLETEFAQHQFLHSEFLNFPGDRHRKFIDEADIPWNFERRDLSAAEVSDFVLSWDVTRPQANPGADFFSVFFIRNSDDLYIADFGMGKSDG